MIDLFRSLPGWLVQHWFIGSIVGIVALSLAYLLILKIAFGVEGVKDIKRRNPNR